MSVLSIFLSLFLFAFVCVYARWQKIDRTSLMLILAALALYYFHFFHARWDEFSLDAQSHAEYLIHIAHTGHIPSLKDRDNTIVAARHPPTYYFMSALLYRLAQGAREPVPLQAARQVSMACFLAFILLGVNLLRRVLVPKTVAYTCALGLLLFWPIGVTMGARITCDPLFYAGQAGVLYFLTRWLETKKAGYFSAAFLAVSVSICAKNGGIIMLYIGFMALAFALWEERRQWRMFLRTDLAASILLACVCYHATQQHGWVTEYTPTSGYDWNLWRARASGFNPFLLLFDTSLGLSKGLFWNMFLHTLLLGDDTMPWKNDFLLTLFNVVFAAILLYLAAGSVLLARTGMLQKRTLCLMGAFTASMLAAMLYMLLVTGNMGYADGRYAYPVVIGIALAHGLLMQRARELGRTKTYRTGAWLAGAFVLLTWLLFFTQYEAG